ncbi:MAG: tRNA uridine-5-carboxymethylaminomethyl(34) synthesis enzyme MnmG [Caldicoprobacterales bacterium]|jgi:tRNA uridine 5-carboxymethylaminomethyl modification enzyme|nr:tRNA uridine-5-carboxymethylaminomethyl(34) synthesis enzyme MnmG [Clostridiales bacterium]
MRLNVGNYDIIVVGGGHAGCEAALAGARMGFKTAVFATNLDNIALLACNPSIGGTSKGHLVREVDALGGQMGLNIDKCFIQVRMLNTAKGPAVHSLRAQADKHDYHRLMKSTLENQPQLDIIQGEVTEILEKSGKVTGVVTALGDIYSCKAVVVATGVYLKSRIIIGEYSTNSGPNGFFPANELSNNLRDLGFRLQRFKTGTPARIDGKSIDYEKMIPQHGDEEIIPFSFLNDTIEREQVPCWLTHTTKKTHEIIRENLHRSPMYSGSIEGIGARYCPSIEDKIVRFSDKESHQVFIEPEGRHTNEMYPQGLSTSLPIDVQREMYRSVPGLENVRIMRPAYAIEYDCIDSKDLKLSLESKAISGLFFAGQINGSSGYEEAAAQGIIAGINAVQYIKGDEPLILDRSQAYVGVLIDDLVTKGTNEPYRMMTSRAEYRLLLRQDNADMRLTEIGYKIGLVDNKRYDWFMKKCERVEKEINRLKDFILSPTQEIINYLEKRGSSPIKSGITLYELLKRPEISYQDIEYLGGPGEIKLRQDREQVEVSIKYEGYIKKQLRQANQFKKMESKRIPEGIDYSKISGLRLEARQKLNQVKPESIGQASRISGVSPADISVLMIYLEKMRRDGGRDGA